MDTHALLSEFAQAVCRKLRQDLDQIARCVALLDAEQLWQRENTHCNSVGNLLLHLTGNVRQWILHGLGGEAFDRDRPGEFAARGPLPVEAALGPLTETVKRAIALIGALPPADFAQRRAIQGYDVTTLLAVFHVAEHFSFHTGQIVHMTKALRDVDLSLYDEQGRRLGQPGGQPW